jgi:hypothetical protein
VEALWHQLPRHGPLARGHRLDGADPKILRTSDLRDCDRGRTITDKKTPIDPITRDDERVNIPRPELPAMMDPDDAKIDRTADI